MGFEINQKVQTGELTQNQFLQQFKAKDQENAKSIFDRFNTNQTKNEKGEEVLDQTEQTALMSFFKRLAGKGKDDKEVTRKDVKNFKKSNTNNPISEMSYGSLKRMSKAMSNNSADGETVTYGENNEGQQTITIKGKEYVINDKNQVVDADGVKYDYDPKTGKLSKTEDNAHSTTTTFENGVQNQQVVKDNDGTTTLTYGADGRTLKQKSIANEQSVHTTNYRENGKTIQSEVIEDKANKRTTTTNYENDGQTKLREVVVDNSTETPTTTTTQYTRGGFAKRTITNGNKTTEIDYSNKTRTVTNGDVETVDSFSSFDDKTGNVNENNITKTVTTDKKNHTRTTTDKTTEKKTVEILDENNKVAKRTATINNKTHEAVINDGSKTITLKTDNKGNILANGRFLGSRMETVGEAAVRLGYAKDSAAYNAIVSANGGAKRAITPGGHIKINLDATALNGFKADKANVDAKAQIKSYNVYQAKVRAEQQARIKAQNAQAELNTINSRIANSNSRAKVLAKSMGGMRQTYATPNHKVYCKSTYNDGSNHFSNGTTWQQHYVYNPINDQMVTLESVIPNIPKNTHVRYITDNGYATLTNGSTIKIDFSNFDKKMKRKVTSLSAQLDDAKGTLAAAKKARSQQLQSTAEGWDLKDVDGNVTVKGQDRLNALNTQNTQGQATLPSDATTIGDKVSYGNNNYMYKENYGGIDSDAIFVVNGAKYQLNGEDFWNLQGQRTSAQSSSVHMMTNGYFNPDTPAFKNVGADGISRTGVTLTHDSSDWSTGNNNFSKLAGAEVVRIPTAKGFCVAFEKGGKYYDANEFLKTGRSVEVQKGTFGTKPKSVTISFVKNSTGRNTQTVTATVNGHTFTAKDTSWGKTDAEHRQKSIKLLQQQIEGIWGQGINFTVNE